MTAIVDPATQSNLLSAQDCYVTRMALWPLMTMWPSNGPMTFDGPATPDRRGTSQGSEIYIIS